MRLRAFIVSIACLLGCSAVPDQTREGERPFSSLSAEELDIYEAVFRYQFGHNASGQQQDAPAYFISVFGNDPSETFLARFADVHPPVRKGSEFKVGQGLAFSVGAIEMKGTDSAEVSGGYYEANLSASGNTYYVRRRDGQWVCEREVMHWISKTCAPSPSEVLLV